MEYSAEFLSWWSLYPRHTHKLAAFRAWKAAVKRFGQDPVLFGLEKAKREEWRGRDLKYIPHASSFLRATDFDDEFEGVEDSEPNLFTIKHWCTACPEHHSHDCNQEPPNCGLSRNVACAAFVQSMRARA